MRDGPILIDGGMGTALIARGLPAGALPEEWLLSAPGEIAAVHAAHAAAGARVLLTCTFSCAAPRLAARLGDEPIEALCARAAALAREAGPGARVAGSLGPTGLTPPLGPGASAAELGARYARAWDALAAAGVDLLWVEGQHDRAEARAALAAGLRTGLPVAVTFGWPERGGVFSTTDGTPALEWLRAAEGAGAAAVGVNCAFPGAALDRLVAEAVPALRIPVIVKPSPGLPGAVLAPAAFAAGLRPSIDAGAGYVGGCCGAGPDHLRAIGALLEAASARARGPAS